MSEDRGLMEALQSAPNDDDEPPDGEEEAASIVLEPAPAELEINLPLASKPYVTAPAGGLAQGPGLAADQQIWSAAL